MVKKRERVHLTRVSLLNGTLGILGDKESAVLVGDLLGSLAKSRERQLRIVELLHVGTSALGVGN